MQVEYACLSAQKRDGRGEDGCQARDHFRVHVAEKRYVTRGPVRNRPRHAHFNDAATFAFALTRHFFWPRALAYWSAQFLGALIAAAILRGSLGTIANVGATLPSGSQARASS